MPQILSDTRKQNILNAVVEGKSKKFIAHMFNVEMSTVYKLIRQHLKPTYVWKDSSRFHPDLLD